ncbi:MAG: prolyl oligopeptidase family serine peptidase [Pirellulales bacterium]
MSLLTLTIISALVTAATKDALAQHETIECVQIPRVLPPVGPELPPERLSTWLSKLKELDAIANKMRTADRWADAAVLLKACRFAIENRELYNEKDFAKVDRLLKLAESRLSGQATPPESKKGVRLDVRGFVSKIDESVQPVGLIIPDDVAQSKTKVPLYVWLHGRGDNATDIHFICERLDKAGEVAPTGAITLHPFGRHCVGYKSAGSTDVMEAIDFATANYPVDTDRIVLIGFSMGGAGVWHLSAHYTDRFVAASPGAGFAETARYQNLTPDRFPPKYEQMLWGVYDVPGYTRNLFNLPVIAYSGENDKQIQAARVMEEAFRGEGRTLEHLIGPGMGHKYHPDVLKDLLHQLGDIATKGKQRSPEELFLQTRHYHFAKRDWIRIDGMQEQYADTRVDAKRANNTWQLMTRNVSRLELNPPRDSRSRDAAQVVVDGTTFALPKDGKAALKLNRSNNTWTVAEDWPALRKHPGISGPIDDAFFSPFLFVLPSGKSSHPAVESWIKCESRTAIERWTTLMRGEPRVKKDTEVTDDDMRRYHVVCWGDPTSNKLLARLLSKQDLGPLPIRWNEKEIHVGDKSWNSAEHVPMAILPNPVAPYRYLVINSGLTFRPAHDKTNSLQNPKLPDWTIIGLDKAPDAERPGRIDTAGFFDDRWQFDPQLTFSGK